MVVPAFNLSSEETEAGALCEFQASQSYTVSACLENKQKKQKESFNHLKAKIISKGTRS